MGVANRQLCGFLSRHACGHVERALIMGTGTGRTSRILLDRFPVLRLTVVDAWDTTVCDEKSTGQQEAEQRMHEAMESLKKYLDRCTIIRGRASEVAAILRRETFEFAYVDVSHQFDQLVDCFYRTWPLVSPGGIVSCGGYHRVPVRMAARHFEDILIHGGFLHDDDQQVWGLRRP